MFLFVGRKKYRRMENVFAKRALKELNQNVDLCADKTRFGLMDFVGLSSTMLRIMEFKYFVLQNLRFHKMEINVSARRKIITGILNKILVII